MGWHRPTPADLYACLAQPRRTVATRAGLVEFAERGEGVPLLSMHGTPGGCDQGLLVAEMFRVNGFRVIAPSRPGYLGTPLTTGRSCADQADAMAALLDTLAIDRIAVLGVSGGGPSSYLLATRHPDRVRCLLEIDSVCLPLATSRLESMAWSDAGVWLMLRGLDLFPGLFVSAFFGRSSDSEDSQDRARNVALMRALTRSGSGRHSRRDGNSNDNAIFADLAGVSLAPITAPTLIIHGTDDRSVPPAHAEHAHAQIDGSDLLWIDGGGHAGFFADEAAQQYAIQWLADHGQVAMP